MPDDSQIFDDSYVEGSPSTTPTDKIQTKSEPEKLNIESDRYGTGKPKRVTLRAKIIHGESDHG